MSSSEPETEKGITWSEWFIEMWDGINLFYALLYEFPKYIYDRLQVDKLLEAFTSNSSACFSCLAGSSIIIMSAIGIGLGVGLGVGLNCKNKQPFISDSIDNSTIISSINSTTDLLLNSTVALSTTTANSTASLTSTSTISSVANLTTTTITSSTSTSTPSSITTSTTALTTSF